MLASPLSIPLVLKRVAKKQIHPQSYGFWTERAGPRVSMVSTSGLQKGKVRKSTSYTAHSSKKLFFASCHTLKNDFEIGN